ncbi:hypothetical protein K450DRAFT_260557 [Umbelopsis ramanniana AG]|uniref:Uncharacterized protein n=1 Tax=Umbelopsis ramanniana AG TaxID=1314678 RepID=A0AAD5E1D1_UMBRA|nr:uncharacterized protein K450DRAFT_260557 [Umbelopsis ramanniana AG]KAI8575676.1 hypothetical protein K450DRAFT_260557 [Umbelopsis ramanniana AG]
MAMSTFWSISGSTLRHLLRRMAQMHASGTHLLSSTQHFQWNCHIDTKISPNAESVCLPEGVQILLLCRMSLKQK